MNVQRIVSSVYFENVHDPKLLLNIQRSFNEIEKNQNFEDLRKLYTTTLNKYENPNDQRKQYILDDLFFERLYGNTLHRLFAKKTNTIILFPIYKDTDSTKRLTPALQDIYKQVIDKSKGPKEFNRDVATDPLKVAEHSGNMYLFIPAFLDSDETIEEYGANLSAYFDRAFEFINEQKSLKVGDIVKPTLHGKFETLLYSVDKEGNFFTNYYKKKLTSDKLNILNKSIQTFTDKFGRSTTSKDPLLTLTKEESLRKYKADGAEQLKNTGVDYLKSFYLLLETFIDAYKKTNDLEYLRSAVSSDNQTFFRIFYRINNTDFVNEYSKIKVGSNYVYKKTSFADKKCKVGYFIEKRGLTDQYLFREYSGLTKVSCEQKEVDDSEKDVIEEELEKDEETKDKIYKEGAIEIVYKNNGFYYRDINRDEKNTGSLKVDGSIEKMGDLHIYEKYKWFQFSDLGSVLNPETKIKFYKNILFDRKSFVEFLDKKGTYNASTKIGIEFLKINQDNKLLLEYVDFLLVNKKKTNIFKQTLFGVGLKTFIENTKKAIIDMIFETNEVIYMTKQKSKLVDKNTNKNYKIIKYKYYAVDSNIKDTHFQNKIYEDPEIKYCKKTKCELFEELEKPDQAKTEYAIVILDATRDNIKDVSVLKQKTYCKKSRKNLLRYLQPFLRALAPRFGGNRKTIKRLRSRRRKYRH